jgi:hypothetical protein
VLCYTKIEKNIEFPYFSGGATFVRWGKHGCPDNDTELVYSGKHKHFIFAS